MDKKRWFVLCDNWGIDGAEVCELAGTFLLDKISVKYDKNRIG